MRLKRGIFNRGNGLADRPGQDDNNDGQGGGTRSPGNGGGGRRNKMRTIPVGLGTSATTALAFSAKKKIKRGSLLRIDKGGIVLQVTSVTVDGQPVYIGVGLPGDSLASNNIDAVELVMPRVDESIDIVVTTSGAGTWGAYLEEARVIGVLHDCEEDE